MGRPELLENQKGKARLIYCTGPINNFLDQQKSSGKTLAETVDYAIRAAYPDAFKNHFPEIEID